MSPLGRERRKVATVRLSVAQGTLRADARAAKSALLRKGFGKLGGGLIRCGKFAATDSVAFQNYAHLLRLTAHHQPQLIAPQQNRR